MLSKTGRWLILNGRKESRHPLSTLAAAPTSLFPGNTARRLCFRGQHLPPRLAAAGHPCVREDILSTRNQEDLPPDQSPAQRRHIPGSALRRSPNTQKRRQTPIQKSDFLDSYTVSRLNETVIHGPRFLVPLTHTMNAGRRLAVLSLQLFTSSCLVAKLCLTLLRRHRL